MSMKMILKIILCDGCANLVLKEMQAAEVKHEVVVLEGAKHGFSNPLADERAKANGVDLGYNSEAEKQGLAKMYALLDRTLK